MTNMVVGRLRIVGDGARTLDNDEKVKIYERVEELQRMPLGDDDVMLLDPLYPELDFGPGGVHEEHGARGNIKFTGGLWVGPAEHPLLPALLKSHNELIELRPAEAPVASYACPDCDMEFDTKAKLRTHQKTAHKES